MVIQSLGAEANAYFYVAWAIGSGLSSIPAAIFTSLFAEGSHEEAQLGANTGRAIKINFLILGTALVLILALSGQLLWLFGKAYSESGTSLLRIIALSAIPVSVTHLYVTIQLVVKSIRRVIITSVVSCCLGLAPSYLLMLRLGLIGAGVGWLSGQTLLALILGVMLWRGRYWAQP
jgi:O-antigen/teichoic acid export membrane protein